MPKPEAKPAPIKKEPEKEPVIYKEELQVCLIKLNSLFRKK